jgi:hypothetical protein
MSILMSMPLTDPQGHCDAVFDHCTSPPGIEDDDGSTLIRARCFSCGLFACNNCTVRVQWFDYGRRRVCANCLIDNEQGDKVANLMWRLAGYSGNAPDSIIAHYKNEGCEHADHLHERTMR